MSRSVSVILTVRHDPEGLKETLQSLVRQARLPDEIVVVDGGSDGGAKAVAAGITTPATRIRVLSAPGCNIARGRNIATDAATNEIIACIDGGCHADSGWLEHLVDSFEKDASLEFVAGFYSVAPKGLLERVVGLSTMRGQLDPVDPRTFNPSGRSMAYTKSLWRRVGGWPEWLQFSEDTLFDRKVRAANARWHFAGDAVVNWRPRTSLRAIAKQFFGYGTGRGQTGIGAGDQLYNLRNATLMILALAASFLTVWAVPVMLLMAGYFYVWAFHSRAMRIVRSIDRWEAYPITLLVMWIVMFSNLAGYLVGWWQRVRDPERFERRFGEYMGSVGVGV